MERIDELIELVDMDLRKYRPGTDSWKMLLAQREDLLRQKKLLLEQDALMMNALDKNKLVPKIDPNVVAQCITGVIQVVGVAIVGFLTRIDKEALRFIRKP